MDPEDDERLNTTTKLQIDWVVAEDGEKEAGDVDDADEKQSDEAEEKQADEAERMKLRRKRLKLSEDGCEHERFFVAHGMIIPFV
ncbi:hypothetical protein F2Q68_00012403 [Brassica cretica]|uniref:Uncharacterized protein n=1 Tax=Brassica cretica TaxID=69181 RepID=A0A8S9KX00_BRACR|nr:hypothetical protein F2Q68_00012403 [Brassica cretica]